MTTADHKSRLGISLGRIIFVVTTIVVLTYPAFVAVRASSPFGFMTLVGVVLAVLAFLTSCGFDWARIAMAVIAALAGAFLILRLIGHINYLGIPPVEHWPVLAAFLLLPAICYFASWLLLLTPWVRAWQEDVRIRNDQLVANDDRYNQSKNKP